MQYLIQEAVILRADMLALVARQDAEHQGQRDSALSDARAEAARLLAQRGAG